MNKEQADILFQSLQKIEVAAGDVYKLLTVLDTYREANPDCDEFYNIEPLLNMLLEKSLEVKQGMIKVGEEFLAYSRLQ